MKYFAMSVCMRVVPKIKCQLRQNGSSFTFFHETECFYKVLGILNLEGQQICMIGSKVTAILPQFFSKRFKKFKHRHVGCLSRRNRLKYRAAHSYFILGDHI